MSQSEKKIIRKRLSSTERRWTHLLRWARSVGVWSKIELSIAILAITSGVATYISLTGRAQPFELDSGTIQTLLLANIILFLLLAVMIAVRLVKLWTRGKRGKDGSKLQMRIVTFFALIAIGPPIMMASASALFFEFGLQSWFSDTVQSTLNNSLQVAEAYENEHRRVIQADINAMASDLNRQAPVVQSNRVLLQRLVERQVAIRALSNAIVFDSSMNVLAQSTAGLSLGPQRGVPQEVLDRAQRGELVTISGIDDDRVEAVIKLDSYFDAYLYVNRAVDPSVIGHVGDARASIASYRNLEGQRSEIQLRFNIIFIVVALMIVMAAIWVALWLANQLVSPIGELVDAAERIGKGDLRARVKALSTKDEIGTLSRAFNRMIQQIEDQQGYLKGANIEMDERRRFTEAVLSGVSASVIGFDHEGIITLPNDAACQFLELSKRDLEGMQIGELIPEILPLIAKLKDRQLESDHGQITMLKNGVVRSLLVRLATERLGVERTGYVLTFDDITEQLADQRTAAWADVARRIAHEIKNPLTPIQLSAERLWRKYQKEITTDPEVFKACTDTIIRQVGDLKRMVDEFSSFARMPEPVFRLEDLGDVTRQAVFLQEVSNPNVAFSLQLPKKPLTLLCDGRLVAQALTNLIKNAGESIASKDLLEEGLQPGEPHGKIEVALIEKDDVLEIVVEDDGKGLPKNLAKNIMEPYVTTREKGTGLGLAIVRKIMEDHGGTLELKNRKTAGARAILRFSRVAVNNLNEKQRKNKRNQKGEGGIAAE